MTTESDTPQVRPRTTARDRSPGRPRAAKGGKIAATGLGMTTMFGLLAAMGYAEAASGSDTSQPELPAVESTPPPEIIVIVRQETSAPSEISAPQSVSASSIPNLDPLPPVQLTARPDVHVVTPRATRTSSNSPAPRTATPAPASAPTPAPPPAPAATTSGSS